MNSHQIAAKLYSQTQKGKSYSTIRLAILGVALCMVVLILTFAIMTGFQNEIQNKVIGLGGHIEVHHYESNDSYQRTPIVDEVRLRNAILAVDHVSHVQAIIDKAGIVKGEEHIEGAVFRGVGNDYDTTFFAQYMVEGACLQFDTAQVSNQILISETFSKKTGLRLGDAVNVYFVQNTVRMRKFTVSGIYNTGLAIYDKTYIICDIRQLVKINGWAADRVDALEVFIDNFSKLDETTNAVNQEVDYDMEAVSVKEKNQEIFDWIDLVRQNVVVLVVLILIITAVTLISTQLTFTIEHIPTIGILKTIGCTNVQISQIFLWISAKVLLRGMVIGDCVGLLICFVQQQFSIIKLNPENYYVSCVPIDVQWLHLLLINVGILVVSFMFLVLPAYLVAKKVKVTNAVALK